MSDRSATLSTAPEASSRLERELAAARAEVAALAAANSALRAEILLADERFRQAFDEAAIAMSIVGLDGRWLRVNRSLCDSLGYSEAELLVTDYQTLTHPDDAHLDEMIVSRLFSGASQAVQVEKRYLTRSGQMIWMLISVTLLRDDQGRPTAFLSQKQDVTARRLADEQLRESEERFRRAFDQTAIGMALVSPEGPWLRVNRALCNILGYSEAELLATDYQTLTHPDEHAEEEAKVARLVAGEADHLQYEKRYIHKSGRVIWALLACSFVRAPDGTPRYYVSQIIDITVRKAAEEAQAELNRRLTQSNRALQDFASVASHDLQEPLRKIQAFGDRLRARHSAALSPDGLDYLSRMQQAAGRMQHLIDDLLTFSRLASVSRPHHAVDLGEVARAVILDLESQIARTGGQVLADPLPTLDADPLLMRQLFQNMISNGLKFHRPDTPPLVRISAAPAGPDAWAISVADNGIGFDEKYLDRIFTVFQRLHGRDRFEGTGMGLAICRRIVEQHRGTITAHSAPDAGATFIITLPARQPPRLPVEAPEHRYAPAPHPDHPADGR